MPIPAYPSMMLPLLRFTGDGKEHALPEAEEALVGILGITPPERQQATPGGKQRVVANRLAWAKTDLSQAGLLECPRRGVFSISDSGRDVLRDPPALIDRTFLKRFESFEAFLSRGSNPEVDEAPDDAESSESNDVAGDDAQQAWVFQCNPDNYRMLEAMLDNRVTTFWARQSSAKIREGDGAVVWISGANAGAYALGDVVGEAKAIPEDADLVRYWVDPKDAAAVELRVRIRVDRLLYFRPLLRRVLLEDPRLAGMNILRQPAGTVFRLKPDEWNALKGVPTRMGAPWREEEQVLTLALAQGSTGDLNQSEARDRLGRLFDRGPASVGLAVSNFNDLAAPGKGLGNVSKAQRAIWDRWNVDREGLKAKANAVMAGLLGGGGLEPAVWRRYWKVAPGKSASEWPWCQEHGVIGTGWGRDELNDVSAFRDRDLKELIAAYKLADPEISDPQALVRMSMVWAVLHEMQVGDVVVANDGQSRVVGRGVVTGGYRYVPNAEVCHAVSVDWFDTTPLAIEGQGSWLKTVMPISETEYRRLFPDGRPDNERIREALERGERTNGDLGPQSASPKSPPTPTSIFEFLEARNVHFPRELVTTYLLSLKTKPFVILSGISGTGKTKLAEYVAEWAGAGKKAIPQPPVDPTSDGSWLYQLSPYNFTHRRFVVNKAKQILDYPETGSGPVKLTFDGLTVDTSIHVGHPDGFTNLTVRIPPAIHEKLSKQFKVGDSIRIRVDEGDTQAQRVELYAPDSAPPVPAPKVVDIVRHAFVPVRPDWLDSKGVLGFYNLLSEKYVATPFLERLLEAFADEEEGIPHFITLDEMNLARVEHYLSDLLSATESRKPRVGGEAGVDQEPIHLHARLRCEPLVDLKDGERPSACTSCCATPAEMRECRLHPDGIPMVPPRLSVPTNVYITGTVNVDETTHMFSPKVLDRANVIEFNDVDLLNEKRHAADDFSLKDGAITLGNSQPATLADFREKMPEAARRRLASLNALLEPHQLHFGYRVANEIGLYVQHAVNHVGPDAVDAALDLQVLQKVLPKLHGTKQRLLGPLWQLLLFSAWLVPPDEKLSVDALAKAERQLGIDAPMPRCGKKLVRMLRRVQEQGFVSFIE